MFAGFMQSVIGFIFLILLYVAWASRKNAPSGSVLVLREFQINAHATEGAVITIRGRVSGLIAWLLTLVDIDTETTLTVTTDRFSLQRASLSGRQVVQAPLATIASTHSAYYQPVWALLMAAWFALAGLVAAALDRSDESGAKEKDLLAGLIIAVVFMVIFRLGRKISIFIESGGGKYYGVAFKPSVIEGVSVDLDTALRVSAILNGCAMRAALLARSQS
jgi:hypothetical protein